MARRNRKNGREGNRLMIWGVSISALAAALAMVYLSLFNTCEQIGRQIKSLEQQRAELQKRVVNEERNWATARSIRNMDQLMEAHGIVMSWPAEQNIIRLRATEPDDPAQYAYQSGPTRRD
jgi:ATP-dependent protease HslVU (ClpYQ) peptidase subunit